MRQVRSSDIGRDIAATLGGSVRPPCYLAADLAFARANGARATSRPQAATEQFTQSRTVNLLLSLLARDRLAPDVPAVPAPGLPP
jgi:hypothetical protein